MARGPLIVRLRNWAASLLAAEGWTVHPLAPRGLRAGADKLRALRQACLVVDPAFDGRLNTLVMPLSFSSAVHARWAGLRAVGHAYDGRSLHPAAAVLPGLSLDAYAAVLQRSAQMVANDTGPGHLAAAVGAPVITLMRSGHAPGKIAKWRPWGPRVHVLHAGHDWPTVATAIAAADQALSADDRRAPPGAAGLHLHQ